MDRQVKDCQSLHSLTLFGLLTDVFVLIEDSGICFHLRSCTEGNGSHQRKVIFRICFVLFLKVEYLKRIS